RYWSPTESVRGRCVVFTLGDHLASGRLHFVNQMSRLARVFIPTDLCSHLDLMFHSAVRDRDPDLRSDHTLPLLRTLPHGTIFGFTTQPFDSETEPQSDQRHRRERDSKNLHLGFVPTDAAVVEGESAGEADQSDQKRSRDLFTAHAANVGTTQASIALLL